MDRKVLQIRTFLLVVIAVVSIGSVIASGQNVSRDNVVKGELLVKFSEGSASRSAAAANRAVGASVLETLGDLSWQRVRLPEGMTMDQALSSYRSLVGVEYAQPNFRYHLALTPNDTQFANSGMYGLSKISAPSAWDLTTGSSSVVVADIDTGLRYTHEDIAPNAWINPGEIAGNGVDDDANGVVDDVYGADFFFNDGNPIDENGHGTHTAGTIGAAGNNALGVVGVNWNVKIMSVKIYDNDGYGTTSAMLVNAYNYVRMMKNRGVNIRATNNSYGGCDEACGYDQATKDGIDAMGEAGIVNVFSAGNDNTNIEVSPSFPVSYNSPSIIGVASSTSSDARSSFSNYGSASVDLAAPGSGIYSTYWNSNSSYATLSGTSMAAPHVTGAIALLAAYNPNLSVASLKASLMNNIDVLAAWNGIVKTGGRLNVLRAMQNQTVCSFTPSVSSMTVPTKGGVFTVNVTSGQNCDYAVKSDSKWVKVSTSNSMSGNGSVTFRVAVNTTIARSGKIKIGDQFLTINQSRN